MIPTLGEGAGFENLAIRHTHRHSENVNRHLLLHWVVAVWREARHPVQLSAHRVGVAKQVVRIWVAVDPVALQ